MPEYLTMKETQALLAIDEDTMFNLIQDNQLRNYRIDQEMRFKEKEVIAFKRSRETATGSGAAETVPESAFGDLEIVDLDAAPLTATPAAAATVEDVLELEEVRTVADVLPEQLPGANPGATQILDADEGTKTAEIQFQDDDLLTSDDVSTQEITVVEPAVGATTKTVQLAVAAEEDDPLAVGASPRDQKEKAAARSRPSTPAMAQRRRQLEAQAAARTATGSGELIWAALLVVPVAAALILVMLMVAQASSGGFTDQGEAGRGYYSASGGQLPPVGDLQPLWGPEGWMSSVNAIVGIGETEMFGRPELPRSPSAPAPARQVTPAPATPDTATPTSEATPEATSEATPAPEDEATSPVEAEAE